MTQLGRRLIGLIVVLAVGTALILLYHSHREEVVREAERDEAIVAASRVKEAQGRTVVILDSATIRRIGLEVAPLQAARGQSRRRLPAEVIPEPERTATLRAPVTGRLSAPQGVTWPRLGAQVSAGQSVAQVSDARPLASPLSGTVVRVEAQPGEIVEAGQVLLEIVNNNRPMVRLPWATPERQGPPASLLLQPPQDSVTIRAHLVGPAPEADPATRHPAYLFRAERRWTGAAPGTPVWALIAEGQADDGAVLVPSRAVVQWEGLPWIYVQRGPAHYARMPVPTDRPAPNGWWVGSSLSPRDTVVITGVQELLSEEFRAGVRVGEESGE